MTRPSDRRLLRYARPARAYLIGLVVVTVAIAGLVILQAQLLATAIAGAFSDGLGLPALRGTVVALAAVVAARAALAWAVEALSYRASAGVKSQLRRDLLRRCRGTRTALARDPPGRRAGHADDGGRRRA